MLIEFFATRVGILGEQITKDGCRRPSMSCPTMHIDGFSLLLIVLNELDGSLEIVETGFKVIGGGEVEFFDAEFGVVCGRTLVFFAQVNDTADLNKEKRRNSERNK